MLALNSSPSASFPLNKQEVLDPFLSTKSGPEDSFTVFLGVSENGLSGLCFPAEHGTGGC